MKSATTKDLQEFKRVGPYLRGRPVGAIVFEPQTLLEVLDVFCDADHACWRFGNNARSRSGMAVMWGGRSHLIKAVERGAKHHSIEQWRV